MKTIHAGHDTPYIMNVEYLENDKGSIQIHICNLCNEVVLVDCEHKYNTWHGEEPNSVLLCNLCGKDGT